MLDFFNERKMELNTNRIHILPTILAKVKTLIILYLTEVLGKWAVMLLMDL